ncbi:MAG: type II toxin-antitoxin system PemK/MazF family toxin [Treponema sp.]|jgi:hypothetical protein|nr:type II toxin-antitoxin system PemK/MazF family toxin [Treponema sp.]
MVNGVPQQGDIINIDLDPRMGHEQQGFHPVIVLSNTIGVVRELGEFPNKSCIFSG